MNTGDTIADCGLEALRTAIAGQVFVPGDAGYDHARQARNLAVDRTGTLAPARWCPAVGESHELCDSFSPWPVRGCSQRLEPIPSWASIREHGKWQERKWQERLCRGSWQSADTASSRLTRCSRRTTSHDPGGRPGDWSGLRLIKNDLE